MFLLSLLLLFSKFKKQILYFTINKDICINIYLFIYLFIILFLYIFKNKYIKVYEVITF